MSMQPSKPIIKYHSKRKHVKWFRSKSKESKLHSEGFFFFFFYKKFMDQVLRKKKIVFGCSSAAQKVKPNSPSDGW